MMSSLFPWQHSQWQILQQRREAEKLPHALLLVGPEGIGKKVFAENFAHSILCSNNTENHQACGKCRQCQLIAVGNHPDLIVIEPEEAGKAIKIEQIRQLINVADKSSQMGGYKVIIINPADAMNTNAANALLKTLEEPVRNTLLILITHRLMSLVATIRSRCQMIYFPAPSESVAIDWLQSQSRDRLSSEKIKLLLSLANNAPLQALHFVEEDILSVREDIFKQWIDFTNRKVDIVALSSQWNKLNLSQLLMHLKSWVSDIIKIQQAESTEIINQDFVKTLSTLAEKSSTQKLFLFLDELNKVHHWVNGNTSLNTQMLIEGLMLSWMKAIQK